MAVAAGIFVEVFLMVFLRRPEVLQREQFDLQLLPVLCLFTGIKGLQFGQVRFVGIVNSRPVLDAHVHPLPVIGKRVNGHKIIFQQLRKADEIIVIDNFYRFGMAGAGTDFLIAWIRGRPVGISDFDRPGKNGLRHK